MAYATVKWLDGKKFIGVDSTNHAIVLSGTAEGESIGMKPSELVLVGLAGCTAYDVVGILEKKRQKLTGLEVQVRAEQLSEVPYTFTKFHIHYIVKGYGLSEKAVEDAIQLSDEKYCSVSNTLKFAAEISHDFEIVEDEA